MGAIRHILAAIVFTSLTCGRAHPDELSPVDDRLIAALPRVPDGLNGKNSLEIKATKSISAIYSYTISAPELNAREWILFAPRPPDLPGQRVLEAATTPGSENIVDLSPLRQPLLRARIPVTQTKQTREITLQARIEADLFSRRLIDARGKAPHHGTAVLSPHQRRLFLRRTPQFDYTSRTLQDWMNSNQLQRAEREGEVDFARRVFLVIARGFTYEYLGKQDRSAPHVCAVGKSDCGGLAVLFTTALRSQGIPARTLAGRWAISAKNGEKVGAIHYYQEHVKAEFFAQGIGWVPVDLSSAILHDKSPAKLEYFGNDRGDFLTLHFDNDLLFDTLHFGIRTMPLLQRPSYWVKGSGNVDKAVIRESWNVTVEPLRPVPVQ